MMKIVFCILSFVFLTVSSSAKTIRVGKQQAFAAITQAIAAADNGDTVLVDPGTYKEKNIIINKSIVLKGIDFPVLDGEKKYEIITIKSGNVVVEGFKIVHSGSSSLEDIAAVKISNSRNVIIRNNILDDNFFGIYSLFGVSCTIEKNHITSYGMAEVQSGNGIHCWKSDSMKIIANKISGHRDGIYFEFVTNSVIWRNESYNNIRYGLHFMFSNDDAYISNLFKQNGAGVAVMYSHGVKMFHNFFEENWGDAAYGLLLKEIADSYIDGNYFTKNTSGIYMEGTSRIRVEKNEFSSNGWGMKIQASCMDNTIAYNNFLGNTFDVGTNGSLVLNSFDHNYWDKYEGYDLNKDNTGDVPYRPVSLYSMIVEK
ncbi:MAG TPA: nitrous oxide reductase family maturation protein NosD, partial [Chitinophagaceae bacterium]|nr:nitrous oxide reductase family maturation protein NosD [Chitinophagaceae bacterium]